MDGGLDVFKVRVARAQAKPTVEHSEASFEHNFLSWYELVRILRTTSAWIEFNVLVITDEIIPI